MARKVAHVLIYAALCVAWWRVLATRTSLPRAVIAASAITVLYAVSDEWHQSLVPGRSGSVLDLTIDAFGVGLAVAVGLGAASRRERQPGAQARYRPRRAP